METVAASNSRVGVCSDSRGTTIGARVDKSYDTVLTVTEVEHIQTILGRMLGDEDIPHEAVIRSIEQAVLQSEQVQAWKRDAERLNWIESEYGADIMCMETEEWEVGVIDYYAVGGTMREALDAAMEKQL